jgi:hypothetical protein
MLPLVLVASAMTDPDRGSSGGTLVLVAAAIVVIAGLCLYLLFRRGSIADRARTDMPDPDPGSSDSGSGSDRGSSDSGSDPSSEETEPPDAGQADDGVSS